MRAIHWRKKKKKKILSIMYQSLLRRFERKTDYAGFCIYEREKERKDITRGNLFEIYTYLRTGMHVCMKYSIALHILPQYTY